MRVYADEAAEIVLRPGFLDIYPRSGPARRIAWEEPPKRAASFGPPRRRVFAMATRDRAWLGEGRGVRIVCIDRADVRDANPLGVRILDALGLGDGRVLVCAHLDDDEGACLRVVDGTSPDFRSVAPLPLPEPVKVAWPAGTLWKPGKECWPEKERGAAPERLFSTIAPGHPQKDGARFFDPVVLTSGPHGIAGASVQNGVVFAVAPDGSRIEAAFRLPSRPDAEIHPLRTSRGILVSIILDGRASALLHVGLDGEVLACRSKIGRTVASGMGPPLLVGDAVLVYERSGAPTLLELTLDDLEVRARHPLPSLASGQASFALWGGTALVSDGESAIRVRMEGGALVVERVEIPPSPGSDGVEDGSEVGDEESGDDLDEDIDDEAPLVPASRPRATGAPSLTLAEAASPSAWALGAGASLEVTVGFSNLGGASRGVYVEIGGAAVHAGLVDATDVRIGAARARLERVGTVFRAELPQVELLAGLLPDPDEKRGKQLLYEGVHRATVTLRGNTLGSGLLTVRIGPLRAEAGRGSIVQGKTLTVR